MQCPKGLSIVPLFIALVVFCSCHDSNRPTNFPALVPYFITVTKEGVPEKDVSVRLFSLGECSYSTHGATDVSGIAIIYTAQGNYSKKGTPVGEYTVVLEKPPRAKGTKTPAELANMEMSELDAYSRKLVEEESKMPRIIAPILTSGNTSPIKVTVEEKGGSLAVDLSEYKNMK